MIKEMNDPTLKVGDTVRMQYPPKYQSCPHKHDLVFGCSDTPEIKPMNIDFEKIFK